MFIQKIMAYYFSFLSLNTIINYFYTMNIIRPPCFILQLIIKIVDNSMLISQGVNHLTFFSLATRCIGKSHLFT